MAAAKLARLDLQITFLIMPYEKKRKFAERAAAKGALRFHEFGGTTHFKVLGMECS